jgi:hypothetical protein
MGLKRKIVASGETSQLVENRALKVVRVNPPSISIQPKKPSTIVTTTTSQSTLKPGFTVKATQAPTNATKTVVVTNADLLKKQLEASQKMVEQFKEQLRQQEMENARLKMLLENGN